ncbi:mammalian cell entry protein [Mycolicibacterium flavescens]|uniref:Mammalian cell entry protein n=2 Tax=Mycolicibacterium flavescens TaxID=1776 RepID=A0A1E3RDK8_MYCFV|nr:mammalian cell entry protein [Mycolicibacterium flavescens]
MGSLRGVLWRIGIFVVACALAWALMVAEFGQVRFGGQTTYKAAFTNASGLEAGNFVRIAGVEVGKVKDLVVEDGGSVLVEFAVDNSVVLTEGSRAVIQYENLIGERFLSLDEGVGGTAKLQAGQTIPLTRTQPALDLDALIGGFRPLFNALNPDDVNVLTSQLMAALQGQGATISSFLQQTATLTNTLADRDRLIGEVIVNLNTVLSSLGDQRGQLAKAVDSLSELVVGLRERKTDIANGVAYASEVAGSVADLMQQARPPLKKVVAEADRVAGTIVADADYVNNLLDTLPESYRILNRQGLYGDFFSFYLCDIVLKLNGKGGQPVYVKVAGQSSGRCTPR